MKLLNEILSKALILIVRMYQVTLRPVMGGHCRFQPTCSDYAIASINKYGALKGSVKSVYRIMRCNPWGGCGCDPP